MKELKLALWYLLMPLWIPYVPIFALAMVASVLLYLLGFEDSADQLGNYAITPVDLWNKLDTRRE